MIRESLLTEVWQQRLLGKHTLLTSDGKKVRVLHPGRKNMDSGPDFRDALITIDGERLKGDVEIHVCSRQWQAHGHHRDPGFNEVVLHVVMWADGVKTSLRQDGGGISILALSPCLNRSVQELSHRGRSASGTDEPCRRAVKRRGMAVALRAVNKAGVRRFHAKAAGFREAMAHNDSEQALYEAVMSALGYAKNTKSFEGLARLLPLTSLREFATRGSVAEIQALMLGVAGLLPPDSRPTRPAMRPRVHDDVETERLQKTWHSFDRKLTMCHRDWRLFRVRPENHPTRRVVAASHLLARCRGKLLRSVLTGLSRPSASEARRELERSLTINADGNRASHRHFGLGSGAHPSLIGRNRARDIIVNVLLPFCFAWAERESDAWLGKRAKELYVNYPGLQENWITRYMERQVFGNEPQSALPHRACYQQGLIQLYRAFCTEHRCRACPLARRNSPRHGQSAGTGYLPDAEAA